jgi:hypothetical protein
MHQGISYTINQHIPRTKGSFRPWAVLTPPQLTFAYRFVYPTLLSAGPHTAFLWDVLTCKLTKVISDLQDPVDGKPLGRITYVELSPLHVLISGTAQLRIFDRETGALAYHISCSSLTLPRVPLRSADQTLGHEFCVSPLVPDPSRSLSTSNLGPFFVAG